jgi:hypothetical protein
MTALRRSRLRGNDEVFVSRAGTLTAAGFFSSFPRRRESSRVARRPAWKGNALDSRLRGNDEVFVSRAGTLAAAHFSSSFPRRRESSRVARRPAWKGNALDSRLRGNDGGLRFLLARE